jgi:hemolysin III
MIFNLLPPDGGLIYKETNLHHFFPEPFNMVSSALFLIPALYWLARLKGFNRQYGFLSVITWLLLIGCIGSTLYHGLRQWHFFIFMDWVPIAIICLMASVYFWIKFTGRQLFGIIAFLVFIGMIVATHSLFHYHNIQLMISLNYTLMVLMIVLPLFLLLWKTKWNNAWLVILALVSFAAAIGFRVDDSYTSWAIGTHFLWHIFGMIATSLMFVFIYRINRVGLGA